MSNATKFTKSLTSIITYLLFAVLILALLFGIMYLISSPMGIYLVYADENITSDNSGITIEWCDEQTAVTFTIQNSDDWGAYSVQDCTVKVIPNVASKNDFEYTVDGATCLFSKESDLTAAFVEDYTTYSSNGFEINSDGEFVLYLLPFNSYNLSTAMSEFISRVYGGSDVVLSSAVNIFSACYFAIEVTSPDGSDSYTVPFTLYTNEQIYSVTLSVEDSEYITTDPYNGGYTIGYILADDSLTIKFTADADYYIWQVQITNATFYDESGVEYCDGTMVYTWGVSSYTLTITNPTDEVISLVLVVDQD